MSRRWAVVLAPDVVSVARELPPDVKRAVRGALDALATDPWAGKELLRDLRGLRSYRARRYRIVYDVNPAQRQVRVLAIGHRRGVYDDLARRRSRS